MTLKALLLAGAVALVPTWAHAQREPSAEPAPPKAKQVAPASVSHVLYRTATMNTAAAAVCMAIFTVGSGSLATGAVLTAGSIATASAIYPINEFVWDSYSPNTNLKANNESFDAQASLWRNTAKWLTFKGGIATAKFALIYAVTGSPAATAVMGTATSTALPAVYFVNNMAWDWYDWYASPATPPPP